MQFNSISPDVYLVCETRADAFALDKFYRQFKGKTFRIEERENENPALILRFQVVETVPKPKQFFILKRNDGKYWNMETLWSDNREDARQFNTVMNAKNYISYRLSIEDPEWLNLGAFTVTIEPYFKYEH